MTVGIVGLGLIGGSFAKAYKEDGHMVYAQDIDESVLGFAKLSGAIDGKLDNNTIKNCDLIILSVLPEYAVEYFKNNAQHMSDKSVVIDCCGTKSQVCEKCFKIAEEHGLTFVGGHPMAGNHKSGFKNSRSDMFYDAPMVIVPPVFDDAAFLEKVENLLKPAKFGSFAVIKAEEHDKVIAFTSQMPHVISNAFIKSPTARKHKGFSAGSYKDLTRVAWLDAKMWSQLFMENSTNLIEELDFLIDTLGEYKKSIEQKDIKTLEALLEEGKKRKEEIDG